MRLARRTVLATLALALLAPPLAAEAQPSGRVPRVGYLGFERLAPIEGFEQGLKDLGWENGRNITLVIETRHADAKLGRLPALAPPSSRTTERRRCATCANVKPRRTTFIPAATS